MSHRTYHCVCSQLLLCTPYDLATLSRRAEPALDRALILPLGAYPPGEESSRPDGEHLEEETAQEDEHEQQQYGISTFLHTTLDRKAVIVRREDGFEKRWIRRCGRCRTSVAYELHGQVEGEGGNGTLTPKIAYVLDESLIETDRLGQQPSVEAK